MTKSPDQQPLEQLLTAADLAALLQVPVRTIERWIYTGDAPVSVKTGRHRRFRRKDVEAWLEARARADHHNHLTTRPHLRATN